MKATYYEIRNIDGEVTKDSEWFLHDPEDYQFGYDNSNLKETTEVAKEISEENEDSNWVVAKITVEYVKVFSNGKQIKI